MSAATTMSCVKFFGTPPPSMKMPVVIQSGLEPLFGNVVSIAQRLEEILIDDVRSGADDAIDHAAADQLDKDALQAGTDERAGQAQNNATLFVAQHAVIDFRRPG